MSKTLSRLVFSFGIAVAPLTMFGCTGEGDKPATPPPAPADGAPAATAPAETPPAGAAAPAATPPAEAPK